jgi:glycerol uptake facilitator-like aquaporin
MDKKLQQQMLAEFFGTLILIFVGAGAVIIGPGNVTQAAFAHGLAIVAIVATFGHISGAHVNPAVTLGLMAGGKIEPQRGAYYILAQVLGAAAAVILLWMAAPNPGTFGQTVPAAGANTLNIAVLEGVLTFILVGVVYQAAVYGHGGQATPLIIGLTLAGLIMMGGAYTGASLNPARTLGPAFGPLLTGGEIQNLTEVVTYVIATIAGGAVAGLLHGGKDGSFIPEAAAADKKRK